MKLLIIVLNFIFTIQAVKLYLNGNKIDLNTWPGQCHNEKKAYVGGTYQGASEITPYVWLGNVCSAVDVAFLKDNGIKNIITMANEWHLKYSVSDDIKYTHLESLKDGWIPDKDSLLLFGMASRIINENVRKGEKTLIHCNHGISRATATVIKYMLDYEYEDYTFDSALEFIKKKRPFVRVNNQYRKAITNEETNTICLNDGK